MSGGEKITEHFGHTPPLIAPKDLLRSPFSIRPVPKSISRDWLPGSIKSDVRIPFLQNTSRNVKLYLSLTVTSMILRCQLRFLNKRRTCLLDHFPVSESRHGKIPAEEINLLRPQTRQSSSRRDAQSALPAVFVRFRTTFPSLPCLTTRFATKYNLTTIIVKRILVNSTLTPTSLVTRTEVHPRCFLLLDRSCTPGL